MLVARAFRSLVSLVHTRLRRFVPPKVFLPLIRSQAPFVVEIMKFGMLRKQDVYFLNRRVLLRPLLALS